MAEPQSELTSGVQLGTRILMNSLALGWAKFLVHLRVTNI